MQQAMFTGAASAIDASQADGYDSPFDGLKWAMQQLRDFLYQPSSGICAQVRLRIDQEAVIARDAFKATLEIDNSSASSLSDVEVDVGGV